VNVIQLDSFNEGFRVAPRKPHRQPEVKVKISRTALSTLDIVKRDLKAVGSIKLSDFKHKSAVKNGIGKLRMEGWGIAVIKEGRKAIGYKLINRQ